MSTPTPSLSAKYGCRSHLLSVWLCHTLFNTCLTFLFLIRDFTMTAMSKEMIRRVWDSQAMKNFTHRLLLDTPPSKRGKVTLEVEHLLETMSILHLDIKEVGSTLHPQFNIYTDIYADCANFSNDKAWSRLRSFLFTTAYIHAIQGHMTLEKIPFCCSCCHSVDHPRSLCPFPNLQGWNGPKRDGDLTQCRNWGSPFPNRCAQRQRFQQLHF